MTASEASLGKGPDDFQRFFHVTVMDVNGVPFRTVPVPAEINDPMTWATDYIAKNVPELEVIDWADGSTLIAEEKS